MISVGHPHGNVQNVFRNGCLVLRKEKKQDIYRHGHKYIMIEAVSIDNGERKKIR